MFTLWIHPTNCIKGWMEENSTTRQATSDYGYVVDFLMRLDNNEMFKMKLRLNLNPNNVSDQDTDVLSIKLIWSNIQRFLFSESYIEV